MCFINRIKSDLNHPGHQKMFFSFLRYIVIRSYLRPEFVTLYQVSEDPDIIRICIGNWKLMVFCGFISASRKIRASCSNYSIKSLSFMQSKEFPYKRSSVAEPGCLSRILIFTHPGSKNSNKRGGWKKTCCRTVPYCVTTNFTQLKIILVLKCWRKKIGPIFKELKNFLPKKLSQSSQNMGLGSGIRDPGSGKNLFRIPDPGIKKAPDPGSGSATLKRRVQKHCSTKFCLGSPKRMWRRGRRISFPVSCPGTTEPSLSSPLL
jgi:hypothetical protein